MTNHCATYAGLSDKLYSTSRDNVGGLDVGVARRLKDDKADELSRVNNQRARPSDTADLRPLLNRL